MIGPKFHVILNLRTVGQILERYGYKPLRIKIIPDSFEFEAICEGDLHIKFNGQTFDINGKTYKDLPQYWGIISH